ncbi:Gibberellin 3-beta-dioxygenase 1 [Hordeum vulgare]|nr:Gibberellin 3-beta-dioxygenase 1 [Hordeum vulgare]
MEPPADALSGTSAGGGSMGTPDLSDFMEKLNLEDKVFDDLVIDEDDPEINESVIWLALARVHTDKSFSEAAFFKDMRAA